MLSYKVLYGIGLFVSVSNIFLWLPIIHAQLKQFKVKRNVDSKLILLIFAIISLASNITPIWFDIFRLTHLNTAPTNIAYAYITSQYLYRTATAIMFYILYRY